MSENMDERLRQQRAETPEYVNQINDQYDQALAARQAQLGAARDTQIANYNAQIGNAQASYDGMRKQAYTNDAMAERSRRESMANMGLSSAGGMSQTLGQRNRSALLGTLGDVSRQQQDFTDNVNLAIENLNTQYNADYNAAMAENAAARNEAILGYRQWQNQFDMTKQNTAFEQAFALLTKRKLTKRQFEEMTGITLR